jgi:hypothetical protein
MDDWVGRVVLDETKSYPDREIGNGRHVVPCSDGGRHPDSFVVARDVAASRDSYAGVFGRTTPMDGGPTIVKLANNWIIINEVEGSTSPTAIST